MAPSDAQIRRGGAARERILETAYDLFSRSGTRAVGVDTIIAESGVAKMTLYRNFASKDDLILEFLRQRDERWTRAWLQAEVTERAEQPGARMLAIFDVFGEWFAREDFEGCAFINVMLELDDRGVAGPRRVRRAPRRDPRLRPRVAADRRACADADADHVAAQWHILMKGSIVAAAEGDTVAAARARELGALLLAHLGVAVR